MKGRKIIVAPLNWGLGHATRCIPIITSLLDNNFSPVIASDGNALELLKREFPMLESIKLPSYKINYGKHVKLKLLGQIPGIMKAAKREFKLINAYIEVNDDVVGIISDNRFGVYSSKVPAVYLTHQLNVFSGWTTWLTTKIHHSIIKKFDECWVPDFPGNNYSGELSKAKNFEIPVKYTGILSRFNYEDLPVKNAILILLSGPEPKRTYLEDKLVDQFKNYKESVTLVRGVINDEGSPSRKGNITTYNYLLSKELEEKIRESELIICRSGYSSIMDLAALGKKVFFIPTNGQNEQEYLASYLQSQKIAPYSNEQNFGINMLEEVKLYSGFQPERTRIEKSLLQLFKRK